MRVPFGPDASTPLPADVEANAYLTEGRSLFLVLSRRHQLDPPEAVLEDGKDPRGRRYGADELWSMGLRRVEAGVIAPAGQVRHER